MISFGGLYTREQLGRGLRLANYPRGRSLLLRVPAALLVVGGLGFIVYGLIVGDVDLARVARTSFMLLVIGAWVAAPYFNAWNTARRAFGGEYGIGGRVGNEGIVLNRAGGDVDQPWSAFVRAYLQEDLVVLVGADRTATILPRSFFSDENDWNSFRQMVQFNVVTPR